jgi:GNAT superfamily N-acetyltransferase
MDFLNRISVEEYNALRRSVGWPEIERNQAHTGLINTIYQLAAVEDGKTVGMARLVGDGGYVNYIADVVVHPDCQGRGLGKSMVQKILDYIDGNLKAGQTAFICLMAASGKEAFYEKLGFARRPNETVGCGMNLWIRK